ARVVRQTSQLGFDTPHVDVAGLAAGQQEAAVEAGLQSLDRAGRRLKAAQQLASLDFPHGHLAALDAKKQGTISAEGERFKTGLRQRGDQLPGVRVPKIDAMAVITGGQ